MRNWDDTEFLCEAIKSGNVAEVKRLAAAGMDLEETVLQQYECTPLHWAMTCDQITIVHTLLECGAKPDEEDYEGCTPTEIAVRGRHYEALQLLLAFGEPSVREARSIHALHEAVKHEDSSLILHLLDAGVDIDAPDKDGYSPLITAIERFSSAFEFTEDPERSAVIRLLLERSADVHHCVASGHSQGLTALYCAASRGHTLWAEWLQNAGAQLTLLIAAMLGDTEAVRAFLAQGEAPNSLDHEGNTALLHAAERGYTPIVHLLLEKGADPLLPGRWKDDPLCLAAQGGHTEAVRALLQYGAGKEKPTGVLSAAVLGSHIDTVLLLLASGWNVDGITPEDEWISEYLSPLMNAASSNLLEMIHLLIAHGANVDLANPYGYTALMCAAQHGYVAASHALLEAGADVTLHNTHDLTALGEVLGSENPEMIALLQAAQIKCAPDSA